MTVLGIVEGPLWYAAAAIFVVGALWRIGGMLALPARVELSEPRASAAAGAVRSILQHSLPRPAFVRRTAFHVVTGYMFHLGLFALLLFGAPHVAFIKERLLGFAWNPMPRWAFIVTAEVAFLGLMLLWLRRLLDPVMRKISDADDHAGSCLTLLVMLTGCFALQEADKSLRILHMLSVEAWLVYFPFSRLMHAVLFLFSRGYTGATYGRRGVAL
jgi:nitrate reductase gamma subunit